MPRHRRTIGPRVKLDISALRDLPQEERLRLLTQNTTEVGGRSDDEWGPTYRHKLTETQKLWRTVTKDGI